MNSGEWKFKFGLAEIVMVLLLLAIIFTVAKIMVYPEYVIPCLVWLLNATFYFEYKTKMLAVNFALWTVAIMMYAFVTLTVL